MRREDKINFGLGEQEVDGTALGLRLIVAIVINDVINEHSCISLHTKINLYCQM
jgi:hypothetical protein